MIPEWAEKYRRPGTTIKQIGNGYYLYSATSKTVKGKKHPVSVQNYLGRITEDGLVNARKHIQISNTQARHLSELVPNVDSGLGNIILLEYRGEWYFTKIPEDKVEKLTGMGLYRDEKLIRGEERNGKERHETCRTGKNG